MTTSNERGGETSDERDLSLQPVPDWLDRPIEEFEDQDLDELCSSVLRGCFYAAVERIKRSPQPDAEELSAGSYRELIEPQCRGAVFRMRQKGYDTVSSGFSGVSSQGLMLRSSPILLTGTSVVRNLQSSGFTVYRLENWLSMIEFQPERHDLSAMESRWDELEELLPDMGSPAPPDVANVEEFYARIGRINPVLHELLPPYKSQDVQ